MAERVRASPSTSVIVQCFAMSFIPAFYAQCAVTRAEGEASSLKIEGLTVRGWATLAYLCIMC
jgi:hypothetical protein